MSPHRATQVATYSVGLGQHRRLFLNDGSLRNGALRQRLAVVAHELTHLAQYELAGGRRGGSEQWLREGMADWIACWVLERLGERTPACRRDDALLAVASELPTPSDASVDLVDLGRPLGWVARHPPAGNELTYRLAFLLTDRLVRQYGLSTVTTYFRSFADRDDRFGNFERAFGLPLAEFEHAALLEIRLELEARASKGDAALRILPTPSER
jgi:hypothetical protein